jgi:Glycosyl hydrolase family 9
MSPQGRLWSTIIVSGAAGTALLASPATAGAAGAVPAAAGVDNSVRYFTSERDGPDVVSSVLDRQPANLTDKNSYDMLQQEAAFGLQWVTKLWDPARKVLYAQVGIGTGNASNTIQGDYNFWFLPQQEDRMNTKPGGNPGPSAYYVKYRPVFPAAPPGQKVSPNLAGRFAADFALGAQLAARSDPASAAHLLSLARGVYAMAKTTNVGQLVTVFPHDFYPATQWKSDMLWGAAEIALADEAAGAPAARVRADLAAAARWARAYIAQGHDDTFNLYDTGAVAEAELIQAMRQAGPVNAFPVSPATLLADTSFVVGAGTTKTASYEDNVVSWPSVEPADDYTANSLLAFALGADQGSGLG